MRSARMHGDIHTASVFWLPCFWEESLLSAARDPTYRKQTTTECEKSEVSCLVALWTASACTQVHTSMMSSTWCVCHSTFQEVLLQPLMDSCFYVLAVNISTFRKLILLVRSEFDIFLHCVWYSGYLLKVKKQLAKHQAEALREGAQTHTQVVFD